MRPRSIITVIITTILLRPHRDRTRVIWQIVPTLESTLTNRNIISAEMQSLLGPASEWQSMNTRNTACSVAITRSLLRLRLGLTCLARPTRSTQ